jgi:hypothetical protein
MPSHSPDLLSEIFKDDILGRFQVLFERFNNDLDGALDRANREYSNHMPSKGDVCEATVRKYLRETLGMRYTVSHGIVFDELGQQSKQQDVIIFDDYWGTKLVPKDSGEPEMLPVESVYAVLEVKKTLSAFELRNSIEKISSFKKLQREKVGMQYATPNYYLGSPNTPSDELNIRNPYFGAIFSFSADRSLEAILQQLIEETKKLPSSHWPDLILVHNKGIILPFCLQCNASGPSIHTVSMPEHIPSYTLDNLGKNFSLLGFHHLLADHLHKTVLKIHDFHQLYAKLAVVSRRLRQS